MDCTEAVSSKHDFAVEFVHGITCRNSTTENSLRTSFEIINSIGSEVWDID
jgi:hypothetical protein